MLPWSRTHQSEMGLNHRELLYLGFCFNDKHLFQKQLGEQRVILFYSLESLRKGSQSLKSRKETRGGNWSRNHGDMLLAPWLAQFDFLYYPGSLFYAGRTHNRCSHPTSIGNWENAPPPTSALTYRPVRQRHFLSWVFLSPREPTLC